jgi:uncharacterized protein Veg
MSVAGITTDGDWIFGRGTASYKTKSDEIRQRVFTRLRLFTNDWFLDVTAGNPWIELFGSKNTQERILRTIERSVVLTEGVRSIDSLELIQVNNREAQFQFSYTDVFNNQFTEKVELEL